MLPNHQHGRVRGENHGGLVSLPVLGVADRSTSPTPLTCARRALTSNACSSPFTTRCMQSGTGKESEGLGIRTNVSTRRYSKPSHSVCDGPHTHSTISVRTPLFVYTELLGEGTPLARVGFSLDPTYRQGVLSDPDGTIPTRDSHGLDHEPGRHRPRGSHTLSRFCSLPCFPPVVTRAHTWLSDIISCLDRSDEGGGMG